VSAAAHLLAVNFRDPGIPRRRRELHLEEILLEAVRRGIAYLARGGLPGRRARRPSTAASAVCAAGTLWNFNSSVPACCAASSDPRPTS
jgi:hypothetical protein